ncbi:tyrosine-type recombinase/integrase [Aeoliella sp.]|uniref:tyrosine-type recombinase/integrase n=1 Tax=Aeoliella sp. TaxID=2795800 RepID=UPI003CCBCFB1
MHETIKVHVVKYPDRTNLVMRYKCPLTGKHVQRTTGTSKQREAEKKAAKWEAELQEGRYQQSSRMSWERFRWHWEQAKRGAQRPSTVTNYAATFNAFENLCRPQRLADLTTAKVSAFAAELRRSQKLTEASIARHLRHLKAIARWAHNQDMLPKVPKFDMPRKSSAQRMKGRPITTEEFERMLAATEGVVGKEAAESWRFLLRGLWATGLRLSEAMALRWDHQAGGVSVALDGKQSVLAFDAESQKSGKVQHVPLAPEAVELLEPHQRPAGYVFNPQRKNGEPLARHVLKIGKTISRIGKAAGVVTDPAKGKTATAHDLRRAFGSRWSKLVMPATLKELMRHESIETTMTYYVQQNAKMTASELWAARGTISGTTDPTREKRPQKRSAK